MTRRTGGLCFLLFLAIIFCAITASSALGAKGTTAFTCEKSEGGEGFSDAHCSSAVGSGAKFRHVAISPSTFTEITASNEKTASATAASTDAIFRGTIGGIKAKFRCTKVALLGTLWNEAGPPMEVAGTGIVTTFSGCVVEEGLAAQGCIVQFEQILSKSGTLRTPAEAMTIEYKPVGLEPMATFKLENCKTKELNAEYKITGSFSTVPEGATLTTTEASSKGLKLGGQQVSLTGKITVTMSGGNPIALTTTES
jgi:hypothetical protein